MEILFLCGREIEYPRNLIILNALKKIGNVNAIVEHGNAKSLALRIIRIAIKSVPFLLFSHFDIIFIGFYGHPLTIFCRLLSRKPILFDAFVSNYDTLVNDRGKVNVNSILSKCLRWLDILSCHCATKIFLDTQTHKKFFVNNFQIPTEKIYVLPVGAIDSLFFPRERTKKTIKKVILFYSTYLPLHGIPYILEAAKLVEDLDCVFILIGKGQEYKSAREMADMLRVKNVVFIDNLPIEQLAIEISNSDICLGGHFGSSPKAERTIPGKVYQFLASAKPIIAASTLANQELLVHLENAYLCPPANAEAIAKAVRVLINDNQLLKHLAENGRLTYLSCCSEKEIQSKLSNIINSLHLSG